MVYKIFIFPTFNESRPRIRGLMVRIAAFQAAGPGSIPGGCTYIDGQKSDPIFFLVWGVNFLDSSGLELDDLRTRTQWMGSAQILNIKRWVRYDATCTRYFRVNGSMKITIFHFASLEHIGAKPSDKPRFT